MQTFHPADFRQQFPALQDAGVYLDSAATTLKPRCLIDASARFYSLSAGTVHRSHYAAAQALTARYERAREQVARWINAAHSHQIIWTRGTTEAINLVAQSWLRPRLKAGDEIVVSEAEHHANLVPWLMLAQSQGARLVKLPLGSDRLPDLTQLPQRLNSKTRLLALGQMSNVTGGCPALAQAIDLAHQVGARVMIDGAQGIVHHLTDVQALDIDFYAFSGHKFYGPMGTGVLYGKPELLDAMSPWHGGGKMLTQVDFDGFTPQPVPWRFEAGTPNVAGVIGLSVIFDWLAEIDMVAAERWSCQLADSAEQQLASLPGFRSFRSGNTSLLSFELAGLHHQDVVTLLAENSIALRAGQHCAQPLMQALGVSGTLRASFAPYNNQQDVTALVDALRLAVRLLGEA
ncbi:cysteine sulfinate desulfinase [Erwinia sp. OLTSP20]|uniref:cysteine desulfurase CsdA n=1 Tax=unclassified Erwinia TaxID=2622719 RepID=UPI000C180B79|nr:MULTISPECIES: cysteine desulfurase CsdA [unclassified Erwinia]PIJ49044.1 cysteine sulfinate desulfinase [Erwinia sp. OAMSP11]PIJ75038.1 cysteine sulfinate desulfinase [Erwinia sp. OLSSP12]PIJ79729.1 cysteine sulfinate desulfinase [Erwinia sp. OLCASP19]PIJ80514.1 cysteine sulfinate desulfinase [Erwinia sp. OLMTSP26]PIJ82629.1 cysteine sulfinate desulfinase [Erwinia sp. OLMDSP33]